MVEKFQTYISKANEKKTQKNTLQFAHKLLFKLCGVT